MEGEEARSTFCGKITIAQFTSRGRERVRAKGEGKGPSLPENDKSAWRSSGPKKSEKAACAFGVWRR